MGYVNRGIEKTLTLPEGYHNKISGRNKQQYFQTNHIPTLFGLPPHYNIFKSSLDLCRKAMDFTVVVVGYALA
jgi:hypothetical protein